MIKETALNPTLTNSGNLNFAASFLSGGAPSPKTRWTPGSLAVTVIGLWEDLKDIRLDPTLAVRWGIASLIEFGDSEPEVSPFVRVFCSAFNSYGTDLGSPVWDTAVTPNNLAYADRPIGAGLDGWASLSRSDGLSFPIQSVSLDSLPGSLDFTIGQHGGVSMPASALPGGLWTLSIPQFFGGIVAVSSPSSVPSRPSSVSFVLPPLKWTVLTVMECTTAGDFIFEASAFRVLNSPLFLQLYFNSGTAPSSGVSCVVFLKSESGPRSIPVVSVSGGSGEPAGESSVFGVLLDLSAFPNGEMEEGFYYFHFDSSFGLSPLTVLGESLDFEDIWVHCYLSSDLELVDFVGVENSGGLAKFMVDSSCIDCGDCHTRAPANFVRNDSEGVYYVASNPETPEALAACRDALTNCPAHSIYELSL